MQLNRETRAMMREAMRREGITGRLPSNTYKPNGKREVARRKRQIDAGKLRVTT